MEDSSSDLSDPESDFVVGAIRNIRWSHTVREVQYLVHWLGYPDEEDTWEVESDLSSEAKHLLEPFAEQRAQLLAKYTGHSSAGSEGEDSDDSSGDGYISR